MITIKLSEPKIEFEMPSEEVAVNTLLGCQEISVVDVDGIDHFHNDETTLVIQFGQVELATTLTLIKTISLLRPSEVDTANTGGDMVALRLWWD